MTRMKQISILVLVGSLRAASVNRQLAELALESAPEGVALTVYPSLGELPFYDEDVENAGAPAAVTDLWAAAAAADAALVVTPEYNGSTPGVLKNAIDWLSRPPYEGPLKGKSVAVIGAAMGRYGGAWAHDETRKSLRIAGADIVDSIKLSVPIASLDGAHPRESAELVSQLREIVEKLVAEVG